LPTLASDSFPAWSIGPIIWAVARKSRKPRSHANRHAAQRH